MNDFNPSAEFVRHILSGAPFVPSVENPEGKAGEVLVLALNRFFSTFVEVVEKVMHTTSGISR
jgi:hypothetical protein